MNRSVPIAAGFVGPPRLARVEWHPQAQEDPMTGKNALYTAVIAVVVVIAYERYQTKAR